MTPQAAQKFEDMDQPEWIERIATPLTGTPCGEDPRYSDDFCTIKQEIDKLKGNDFARVEVLAIEILSSLSKDLRVAGYLMLASTYTSGICGLIDAAGAYLALIERFGKDCYPQKESMRLTALDWLNNAKLENYVRLKLEEAQPNQLIELRLMIDAINEAIVKTYGDTAPRWNALDRALDKALNQLPADPDATEAITAQPQPVKTPLKPGALTADPIAPTTAISSERDLVAATRAIRDYLVRNKEYLKAIAYTRALRWGALQLPPHENGKTRIAAPRPSALNELQQLASAGNPEALLTLCENLFLEGGNHLLLDLQRTAFEAAQGMGQSELAEFIADQSVSLARRIPELTGLQFENGHPFADMNTRSWIEERLTPTTTANEERGAWDQEYETLLERGRQLLRKKQLPAALNLFRNIPVQNEKQRLHVQLGKARLCLEGDKAEVALPVLEDLSDQVERQSLNIWDPSLAIEIWKQQLEATQACMKKATGEDKVALANAITRLKRQICRTDPEAAARLL